MTSERDFDRIARAWLDLGPNEAPDRAIDSVLQAVESMPQVRRPFLRPQWRSIHMTRLSGAAIVAALVVVVGGGILFTRGGDQSGGVPSASPPPTASPTTPASQPASDAASDVPLELQGTWMGGPKSGLRIGAEAGAALMISRTGLAISQSAMAGSPALSAEPSVPAAGRLRVIATASDPAGCPAGAAGDYTWTLAPSGRRLTVAADADPCAVRLASLPGDWLRMACKDPKDNCLGDLDAGTYKSQFIDPRLTPGVAWRPRHGGVTYTVPDGWANAGDWPADLELVPSADYAAFGPSGGPPGVYHEVDVWALPAVTDQPADCSGNDQISVDRSVDGYIAWLRAQPRLVVSEATQMTVGGRPATSVDLSMAPDWTGTCPDLAPGQHAAQYLTHQGAKGSSEAIGIVGQERHRLVLVDLGKGDLVAIIVDATDPAAFDALAAQAMPIIESMTFE